ncbi:MAG: CoA transferase [Chloroflexi bacterium]|nr:MAG: CoA transferase [Chloroflexota bacterium]
MPTATLSWAPGGDWRLIAEQRSRATTVLRASEASGVSATATLAAPAAAAGALAGLRVVELGWAAAGPFVGKYLANHGAEVIHLESRQALDPFRTTYPPFKGEPAPDRAGMFAFYNDGKRGATLNLRDPRAADLALRLVAKADVVIESFPAGTLARRGLSHEAMRRARPDVVVLSSCNQGQTGPHAQHPGYGSQLTALAGFNELLGEPDRSPVILYGPYIDYIAVGYGVIAILAALERRRRTGEGCLIDLSQYEAGLQFMAPALLELAANGTVPTRAGNRDPQARPHGVYRCADGDDAWVALSVWSADEWSSFREAVAHPEWSRDDPRLDALVEGWTRERTRDEVTATLRRAGLRVQPVLTIPELREDEQLRHRAFWRSVPHPVLESITVMAPPFILSDTPAVLERAGPTLGQDNGYVFRELLGLDESEYRALEAEGVFA